MFMSAREGGAFGPDRLERGRSGQPCLDHGRIRACDVVCEPSDRCGFSPGGRRLGLWLFFRRLADRHGSGKSLPMRLVGCFGIGFVISIEIRAGGRLLDSLERSGCEWECHQILCTRKLLAKRSD